MAVDIPAIREVVQRACTRQDVLGACQRRDLGAVITVLSAHGITQGQIAGLTGITQGRLSESPRRPDSALRCRRHLATPSPDNAAGSLAARARFVGPRPGDVPAAGPEPEIELEAG